MPSVIEADIGQRLGYTLSPQQEMAIKQLLAGTDVFAVTPTGSGKSLIFQSITAQFNTNVTVIITPLNAISYMHKDTLEEKVRQACLYYNCAYQNTMVCIFIAGPGLENYFKTADKNATYIFLNGM